MRIINNKNTVPLNGWRSRVLAEYQFGDYSADDKLIEGLKFLVPANIIQGLPDFDTANQDYVDQFVVQCAETTMLVCTVEEEAPNYGVHISLALSKTMKELLEAYDWGDYIKATVDMKKGIIDVYWRDVRPSDRIMQLRASDIRDAGSIAATHLDYRYDNDLVPIILKLHGDLIQRKLQRAGLYKAARCTNTMMKIYSNKQVADDFKKLSGTLKRDFKVITHTHDYKGYIAVVQLKKGAMDKIVFVREGKTIRYQ